MKMPLKDVPWLQWLHNQWHHKAVYKHLWHLVLHRNHSKKYISWESHSRIYAYLLEFRPKISTPNSIKSYGIELTFKLFLCSYMVANDRKRHFYGWDHSYSCNDAKFWSQSVRDDNEQLSCISKIVSTKLNPHPQSCDRFALGVKSSQDQGVKWFSKILSFVISSTCSIRST